MNHFKKYASFYLPYLVFVTIFIILLFSYTKADLHLLLNSHHSHYSDVFFRYYTEVGSSIPYIVAVGLLFYRYREGILVLLSQLTTTIIIQLIKFTWNEPRPITYFTELHLQSKLPLVEGVHLHSMHSFPSGHTAAAFAFFLTLTYFTHKRGYHFLYFLLALLVGYSRIYLSQHFALDALCGSVVAVSLCILQQKMTQGKNWHWANGSLRDVFFRKKHQ